MKRFSSLIWGVVFICVGVILGLNAMNITNIDLFFDGWWTLFIIIPSFIGFFKDYEKIGNIIGLLVGISLLLCCQDILSIDLVLKLALPVILVLVGLSFVFRDLFSKKYTERINELNKKAKESNECYATFSGQELKYDKEEFKGTTLTSIFGGIDCDLKSAIISEDVVINCSCVFGGIDLYLPENVKVKVKSSSLFGGVSDDRKHVNESKADITVYINASCIFGGVDIK